MHHEPETSLGTVVDASEQVGMLLGQNHGCVVVSNSGKELETQQAPEPLDLMGSRKQL
jgi:hypothetical protein